MATFGACIALRHDEETQMNSVIYTVKLAFDTLLVSADLAKASAPIRLLIADDDHVDGYRYVSTPYQTADCEGDERLMAILAVRSMGGEYWQDPFFDYDGISDDDAIDAMIISVTPET